ncbi:hypothetical protein PII47_19285 [Pseudomonas sp. 21TX0197]|nr:MULTISPECIES: hypothetical protein [Pseudomonas]MDB6445542.1 hypothetical protein [Pseudomonas sp. 21TX0197]MDT8906331.1 hypothetical protein [Pseudomonas prosekii]NHN67265.1 hypothetical protein [Pseudomonas fluorescens]ROO35471.1 hypothetical protein BIV08_04200 [Pseudomonas sp. AF76]ROO37362.1 hypothetical protein BIV09_00650 [Pseudomonas sp. 7SR1]
MKSHATRYGLSVLALLVCCGHAQAGTWQICKMDLEITDVLKRPFPQLQAKILKANPASASVECPEQGSTLTFTPETADYQATLPRRQWPRKGQSMQVDYRYLDGICKGDGNSHPCRIKHYPIGR